MELSSEDCFIAGSEINVNIDAGSLIKMMESSYDGIWITDGEGRVLFANEANARLLGAEKGELVGRTTQELLKEGIFSDSAILEAISAKRQVSKTNHNPRTSRTVLATATPILNEEGRVQYVFNNVRDITDLNRVQENLREKEAIILQQEQNLQNMKIRLGEGEVVANSKAFQDAVLLSQRVGSFDGATVLILGESGTGKEVIARYIVENSPRKEKPYLQINCGAIPENLIESELFGYMGGSFSGADAKGRKGLFESANGGTVFLDEIGDLPLHMQVKLLRVLQQRTVTRVGGRESIALDVRVIAATNKNLEQMVQKKLFREDLYYRLNVVCISLPPLRERKEDIMPLLYHFLTVANQKYGTEKKLCSDTIDAFESYDWPGNVRELENTLENLIVTTHGDMIRWDNLPTRLKKGTEPPQTTEDLMPLKAAVEKAERNALTNALRECGSVRKAAVALGVDPSTVTRKLQQYHLRMQDEGGAFRAEDPVPLP